MIVTDASPANSPDQNPRPRALDASELGFRRRKPVPWLGPVLLAAIGTRVALAEQFGAYLDKRELQSALTQECFDHSETDELWLDYVADVGDGFDATYSVAYTLAQPRLSLDGVPLPRGEVLVLGGDQVYPTASSAAYDDRFRGPYRAALPACPGDQPMPTLYALPGNHDWYDGLTAFLRLFARRGGATIGGWRTAQARSYFALKLPHRWWLFAIDAQTGAYLDDPQLTYFSDIANQVRPGDRVIVCTPNPFWVEAVQRPGDYDTTDYFLRKVIAPTGAQVALMLSGDLHHYARYANPDRQLITSGGGGAYLYPTHELPAAIMVPPRESIVRSASTSQPYTLTTTYPSRRRSLLLGLGVFYRMLQRNPGFLALLGVLHTLLLLALDTGWSRIVTIPTFLMVSLTMGLTMFFSIGLGERRRLRHYALGILHGALQVGLGVLGVLIWRQLPFDGWHWPLPVLAAAVLYGPVAALASAELVAGYLLLASAFRVNVNELFASQGIQGYKGFLRLHVATDGTLTIYPIAIRKASKRWRVRPGGTMTDPWIEPRTPIKIQLIEPPIRLP
jgi:Calcineurin-like phosphoesterase